MKYGAQNKIQAEVESVKKGDIMSLVKFTVTQPHKMASVLTAFDSVSLLPDVDTRQFKRHFFRFVDAIWKIPKDSTSAIKPIFGDFWKLDGVCQVIAN